MMPPNASVDPLQAYQHVYEMAKSVNKLNEVVIIRALQTIQAFSNKPELVSKQVDIATEYLKPFLFDLQINPNPFEPVPDENILDGDIKLGRESQFGFPFGLNIEELNEHLLITGRAGAGKTTLIYLIIAHLLNYEIPFWAFDFKQDYRHLAKSNDVLVFDWQNFKFNPLRPPIGVDPKIWLQAFINIFCQAYFLLGGSKAVILQRTEQLYKDYGVYEGSNVYPTLFDLHESLEYHKPKNMSGREGKFYDSCLNRFHQCNITFQNMLDCDLGYPVEDMLDRNVVFELEGLITENQSFLLTIFMRYVFQYRMSNDQRGQFKHVFLFDEAKSAYSKQKEFHADLGISEIAQFTSKIREFGEGLVVADQMPTELADSIKANVFCVICMSQSGGANVAEMSRAMGLTHEQADACRVLDADKNTQNFEALVKLNGRWQEPFKIQVAPFQVEKSLSEAELASEMQPVLAELDQLVIPRTPYQKFLEAKSQAEKEKKAEARKVRREETKKKEAIEDNTLIKILTNIREHPFIDQKARIQLLGLSSSTSTTNKLFKELAKRELVTVHRIGLGRGKSTRVLYEITEKGKQFASMDKVEVQGKGGLQHKFWQHTIKEFYENLGYKAEIEKLYGSKNVDVGLEIDNKRTAVEVELTPENLIENIEKDLDSGCERVIIAVPNRRFIETYKKKLESFEHDVLGNVEFKVLSNFI